MERSRDWMDQAEGDLAHARSDLREGFYDWACFSAQQAAEMAVKAVFQRLGAEAWGHSVADLLAELAPHHAVSETLRDAALELDKAYIPTRYPNAHPSGAPAVGIRRPKRRGSSTMPEPSSSSVRIFYPRRDRAAVVRTLRDGLPRLRVSLPCDASCSSGPTPEVATRSRVTSTSWWSTGARLGPTRSPS